MAQRIVTTLLDDLDGSEATQTVVFGLDGKTLEIDLNEKNAAALRKALDKYAAAARTVSAKAAPASASGRRQRGGEAKTDPAQRKMMRDWARANGFPNLGERGRIPAEAVEAYNAQAGRSVPALEAVSA